MRVRKRRLKLLKEGKECYKLDGANLCFEDIYWTLDRCFKYDPEQAKKHPVLPDEDDESDSEKVYRRGAVCRVESYGWMNPKERYAYIDWYGVAGTPSRWRRKGYGGKTYRLLEQFLKEKKGVTMIRLLSLKRADRFWRKMGFHAYRCEKGMGVRSCKLGHPDDEMLRSGKVKRGGSKAKLLCGYIKDHQGRTIESGYNKLNWIDPGAVPNKPCYPK